MILSWWLYVKSKPYPPSKIYPARALICYFEDPRVIPDYINLRFSTFRNFKRTEPSIVFAAYWMLVKWIPSIAKFW